MHFPVYNDPNGTQFQESGGLQLAGMDGSLVDLDEKYSYPGASWYQQETKNWPAGFIGEQEWGDSPSLMHNDEIGFAA